MQVKPDDHKKGYEIIYNIRDPFLWSRGTINKEFHKICLQLDKVLYTMNLT